MRRKTLAFAVAAAGMLAAPLAAREPEPVETRRGAAPPPRFIPEQVDTSRLHPPPQSPRERRRLYERVEEDVDRGRGRVEDAATYEARQRMDARDERLRRIAPRREAERFQEEYDRTLRLERQVAKRSAAAKGQTARDEGIVIEPSHAAAGSTLARFVEEQQQLLDAARQRYQADLRVAEVERDEAARAPGATRREQSTAARRFEDRRSELTREYQSYRRKILGEN